MAVGDPVRYGYISPASAHYLAYTSTVSRVDIPNTLDGYLAALPPAMHHHIVRDADQAAWECELKHAQWLRAKCRL